MLARSQRSKRNRRWLANPFIFGAVLYIIGMAFICGYAMHALGLAKLELGRTLILVSSDPSAVDAAAAAFKHIGAHVVPLGSAAGNVGGAVVTHTTALLHSIPPGIEVVYLLPSPAQYASHTLQVARVEADNRTVCECSLRNWAAHYHHWRLLTRVWNNTLLMPMEEFCSPRAAFKLFSFLGLETMASHSSGLCRKSLSAQITGSTAARKLQSLGGDALLDQINTMAQAFLETNGAHNVFKQDAACGSLGLHSHFTQVNATFAEYSQTLYTPNTSVTAKGKRTINLLSTYFPSLDPRRKAEVDQALLANFNNPYVDQVHVFIDGTTSAADVPLDQHYIGSRAFVIHKQQQPTYADLVEYANQHLQGQIAVMHNVDCVFTDTVQLFHKMDGKDVYGLSRQQSKFAAFSDCEDGSIEYRNQCYRYGGSHDAFAFIPPVPPAVVEALRYKQNAWFADQKTVAVFEFYNFTVSNPCYDIVLLHDHCSNIRGGSRPGSLPERPYGYGFLPPTHVNYTRPRWMYSLQNRTFYEV